MDNPVDRLNLKVNQALCINCKNILTSRGEHDMVVCSCGFTAVDGGNYLRTIDLRTATNAEDLSQSDNALFKVIF